MKDKEKGPIGLRQWALLNIAIKTAVRLSRPNPRAFLPHPNLYCHELLRMPGQILVEQGQWRLTPRKSRAGDIPPYSMSMRLRIQPVARTVV
jgi:hypothetical protein